MTTPPLSPAAPDWRELCRELRDAYFSCEDYPGNDPRSIALIARADAALATPPAPTREVPPLPTAEDMNDLADDMLGIVLGPGEGARLISRALELWGNTGAAPVPRQGAEITPPRELVRELTTQWFSEIWAVPALVRVASDDLFVAAKGDAWARAQAARPVPAPETQLPPEQEFLLRLYQLLEQFDAELLYNRSDDGVHAQIGEGKPLAGFMYRAELRDQLVKAGLLPAAGEVQP